MLFDRDGTLVRDVPYNGDPALVEVMPGDGCACRKPAPGLVLAAADELGVTAAGCVVLGDIGADVAAARAAGACLLTFPGTPLEPVEGCSHGRCP